MPKYNNREFWRKGYYPTVSWGDENSFEFCFDGIEEGSVVAVSTYYRENCAEEFLRGYNQMLTTIKPSAVLCYGDLFPEMKGNVKAFLPTTDEWINTLDWKDRAEFEMRKKLRNVIDC